MKFESFISKILAYNPKANVKLIKKAYEFAREAHKGQKRISGKEYFSHPSAVAKILIEMKADSATIAAALLHDTVEDTTIKIDDIKKLFGDEVANLVEGLTKIDKVHFESKEEYTVENIRKVLIATGKDIRVILIKLADRLHNMKTLDKIRKDKQVRIAKETLEIYAPIAHKLGIYKLKGELEDLSLRYLMPEIYRELAKNVKEKRRDREANTKEIITIVKQKLREHGIHAKVEGRAKYFYSIYKKMQKKNVTFDEIYDLIAIRIITKTIPECYSSLGIVHELWKPIPHRFKDYISVPKSNGYQSLHTSVLDRKGRRIEIQIRTEEMHQLAEEGIAAHWRYHGTERDKSFDKKIEWLKQLLEWRASSSDVKEFIEDLKVDLFQDEVVVFTPKGDPISLPMNSTVIDFAYAVHSNIGDHCSKALVNNKIVPLDYIVESGDIIKIITNSNAHPSRQWLKSVKTTKARSKIRQYLNIKSEADPKAWKKKDDDAKGDDLKDKNIMDLIELPEGTSAQISGCCNITVHEKVIGLIKKGGKMAIHNEKCPNIHSVHEEKRIKLKWKKLNCENIYIIRIVVEDRVGTLANILTTIARYKLNIKSINTRSKKTNVINTIHCIIPDPEIIPSLISSIKKIRFVVECDVVK